MKEKYLFPCQYKKIGWVILIPSMILGFITVLYEYEPEFLNFEVVGFFVNGRLPGSTKLFGVIENNILNEILGIAFILGALLVAFSKEQQEDEFISKIRLESLVWATYINYAVLLLAFIFVYDFSFYWVMIFNMFTIILFFIVRFNWQVWKLKKGANYEE